MDADMNWLRRLLDGPPPRGTLAILDGALVFGFPPGREPAQDQMAEMTDRLRHWLDKPELPLVLEWPIDVIDLRGRR